MAKTKGIDNDDSAEPAKNLQKIEKPKKKNVDAAMVTETINELKADLKNGDGAALVAIRRHISLNYGLRMSKERQQIIKEIIEKEFDAGRIVMTNHNSAKINFTKRFMVVDEDEEEDTIQAA